jgi:hypothetical protein
LAIVAWIKEENHENGVVVFAGTFRCAQGGYFLDGARGKSVL